MEGEVVVALKNIYFEVCFLPSMGARMIIGEVCLG